MHGAILFVGGVMVIRVRKSEFYASEMQCQFYDNLLGVKKMHLQCFQYWREL